MRTAKIGASMVRLTDDDCWAAVVASDQSADGTFVYSVRSTGVYCRPSCKSRLPKRENVAYHPTTEAAEQEGFRACKRCRPAGPSLRDSRVAAISRACRLIEKSEEPPDLDTLAQEVGMSRFHFHRIFKAVTGLTPKAYGRAARAARLREALPKSASVTEAIYRTGFRSNGNFYSESSQSLGMTPTRFRTGGSQETIRFAVADSSLGSVLVAATDKGICTVALGDDPEALEAELRARFDKARLVADAVDFNEIVAKVVQLVEHPETGIDLPLDLRGTAFQARVWRALCQIPSGGTATYGEIADSIGAPKAARAVARACASNAIAIAIPCHRVVRGDGSLSGYRWGVERKRALLEREAKGHGTRR